MRAALNQETQQLLLDLGPPPAASLDNFITGRNAELVQALHALQIPQPKERCLYLWGEHGSGRSHLLKAVAAAGDHRYVDLRDTAEPSICIWNSAIRLWAIDHADQASPAIQIALFNLINEVRSHENTCIVIAGSSAPLQMNLREDLRSRLGWGLVFQVHPLTDADKDAALSQHASERGLNLPAEVRHYLLTHFARDMPTLMSLVDALDTYALQRQRALTLPLLREFSLHLQQEKNYLSLSEMPLMSDRSSRRLTLFDLDNTLLPIDSDHQWGEFLTRQGIVDGEWYRRRNEEFFEQYKAGTLNMDEFLTFVFAPLAQTERKRLDALHVEFMREVIALQIKPSALALVKQHQDAGDLCAVVTATNAFVTEPIVRAFSIPHLIATVPAQENGRFTGAVRGLPCFRENKVTRVEQWLESMGLYWGSFSHSTFYSDSKNDLALLEHVTEPVVTNPDAALLGIAQERGWRILRLFDTH